MKPYAKRITDAIDAFKHSAIPFGADVEECIRDLDSIRARYAELSRQMDFGKAARQATAEFIERIVAEAFDEAAVAQLTASMLKDLCAGQGNASFNVEWDSAMGDAEFDYSIYRSRDGEGATGTLLSEADFVRAISQLLQHDRKRHTTATLTGETSPN